MFELAQPLFLMLLPLPLLIWRCVSHLPNNIIKAIRIPFYDALIAGQARFMVLWRTKSGVALLCIWGLLIFSLAQPRWIGAPLPSSRDGRNIMISLDLSGSMGLNDIILNGVAVNRLAIVKQAAKEFVVNRVEDNIGLVLFGEHAYIQTPLTFDHINLIDRIDAAVVGLAGNTTAIGDAIGLAVKHLQNTPVLGRVIILLTDGVNNAGLLSPEQAAELARTEHIKIYTIGLGSTVDSNLTFNSFMALNGLLDLDEKTLQKISFMTNGRYFKATDAKSLQDVYAIIDKLEKTTHALNPVIPKQDYYFWGMAIALLILFGILAQPLWMYLFAFGELK